MKPSNAIERLRSEHQAFLNLATRIEKRLESAARSEFSEHVKSLKGIRPLEHKFAGIRKHCHAREGTVDSTYDHSLQPDERARIRAEHEQLIRLLTNFAEELQVATPDRTMAMILPGMDLVKWLRAHVAFEREMLNRIARSRGRFKKVVSAKKVHSAKTPAEANHTLPYTMEPHPEL